MTLRQLIAVGLQNRLGELEAHRFKRVDDLAEFELACQAHQHAGVVEGETGKFREKLSHVVNSAAGSLIKGGGGENGSYPVGCLDKGGGQTLEVDDFGGEAHRPGVSAPQTTISPSPMAACMSPAPNMAPSTPTVK